MSVLGWIFFGLIAGFIASKIVNRQGEGCFLNIALGLVGALVGGTMFSLLGTPIFMAILAEIDVRRDPRRGDRAVSLSRDYRAADAAIGLAHAQTWNRHGIAIALPAARSFACKQRRWTNFA